jgi:MFS family permease
MLLMFGTRISFGLYIKPLADSFGATRASISFAQSLYMISYAVIAVFAGSLTDRIGPRQVMMAGAFFLGAGILLAGCITAVWHYYLTYGILAAIGSGGLYVPVVGAVSKLFTRRRNLALAVAASGSGVGQYLIPPVIEKMLEREGWQTSFFLLGSLILIVGIGLPWILLRGRALPENTGDGEAEHRSLDSGLRNTDRERKAREYTLRQALSTRPFWTYFGMYFIICFVIDGTIFVHLYPYLTDIGFSGQTAANALGILGLISTISMVVFSPLGDRFNKRMMLTSSIAIHTILLVWLIQIRSPLSLWAFIFSYGIILGAAWPLTVSILAEIFGTRGVTAILGACTMAFGFAGLIAPWLAGYMFDLYRSYIPIFYFTVLLSFLGGVCAYFTRQTEGMA